MNIPLYIFLVIYAFFLIAFILFFIINIGHLYNTGTFTPLSMSITLIVIVLSAAVLFTTWTQAQLVDWSQPLLVMDSSWLDSLKHYLP
jgi:uncharacterized membrane protein YhhN